MPSNAAAWLRTKYAKLEVGPAPYTRRAYRAAPEPLVVGHGLDFIQVAFDTRAKGVSARKIVVTL